MKRVILLLILITSCLWAKTWTQFLGGNSYFNKENDSITVVYSESIIHLEKYLLFDSTLMTIAENPKPFNLYVGEEIKAIDYFGNNSSNSRACFVLERSRSRPNCFFNMKYYSKIEDNNSIWVQKNSGFLFYDSLDLQDTNFFIIPSIKKDSFYLDTDKGFLLEDYSLSEGYLDSIYFIYKKDSSYYAYCLYTQSKECRTFFFQCTFQDDGSTQFEPFETIEYPYPYYGPHKVDYSSNECMTKSQYEKYMPIPLLPNVKKENKKTTPYLVNGTPSESNHSKITIQNKQPKLQLKK
jgi:hypothetical protein